MATKKLTAVSVTCNGQKEVRFMMLDTQTCIRAGQVDIKSVISADALNQFRTMPKERGVTYSIG